MWTDRSKRFCEGFGIGIPIVQAPMAGGPTTAALVGAVSNGGALGSLGAGYLSHDELRGSIKEVKKITTRPFGVNVFVPPSGELNRDVSLGARDQLSAIAGDLGVGNISLDTEVVSNFEEQVAVLAEEAIANISFTFGVLDRGLIHLLRQHGVSIFGTATCTKEAKVLEDIGVDAIVAQGYEAGGHRGSFVEGDLPQVGLFSLIPQICDQVRIPVIASGGIMDGRGIAAALSLGAAAVQMGTAFLATKESGATDEWKDALSSSNDTSTVVTRTFSGKAARGIRNRFIAQMEPHADGLPSYPIQNRITQPIRSAAKKMKNREYQSLWAGQAAALCRKGIPAAELLRALVDETEAALQGFYCD